MDKERLSRIYDKTQGYCHICYKKLSFTNYGIFGSKGAWEVEHSLAKANEGTDHLNNLYPACISCNRVKRDKSTKTVRSYHGYTRAPYSKMKTERIRTQNTIAGTLIGGVFGSFFSKRGALIFGIIGGAIGNECSPKK